MPERVNCPSCGGPSILVDDDEYRCKKCGEEFDLRPRRRQETRREAPDPPRPVRRRRDDDEEPRRRKRAAAPQNSNIVLWAVLGGFGLLCLGTAVVAVGYFVLARRPTTSPAPVAAAAPPIGAAAPGAVLPKAPAELYGDQGGEAVAPADAALPNTIMRARREDTFYKLSNPREGETMVAGMKRKSAGVKRTAFLIDYEVVRRGKFDGGTLVVHTAEGTRITVALNSVAGRDRGTIEIVGAGGMFGKGLPRNVNFPKNAELYVTRIDNRYRPPASFKVSNSVVYGEMKVTTQARDWTPEEIDRYGKAPPN